MTVADELLTDGELRALAALDVLVEELTKVVADGGAYDQDLGELVAPLRSVQTALMGQAAARSYPDRFRLLGCAVPSSIAELPADGRDPRDDLKDAFPS